MCATFVKVDVILRLLTLMMSVLLGLLASPAHALSPEQAARIAAGDSDARIAALNEAVTAGDASLVPFVQALLSDEVKVETSTRPP